jgi:hypothetical protein
MIRHPFSFYLKDSKYNITCLKENLKEAFDYSPIFDLVEERASGIKFTVTAITISDAILYLILNYNGQGIYSKELSRW